MSDITIVQQTSPHLRRKDTLAGMMIDVLIALAPVSSTSSFECCHGCLHFGQRNA
jgi:Na+-translocating ferredoxin:NAD+ oxidoreductase RnfD subunit